MKIDEEDLIAVVQGCSSSRVSRHLDNSTTYEGLKYNFE
jgi:hypothetical protein